MLHEARSTSEQMPTYAYHKLIMNDLDTVEVACKQPFCATQLRKGH